MRRVLTAGVLIICMAIGVSLVVVIWQHPSHGQTLVEVLRILVSWPMVVGLLGFSAGVAFRTELSGFLKRLGTIRLPGGTEISSAPLQPEPENESPVQKDGNTITLTRDQADAIRSVVQELYDKVQCSERELQAVRNAAFNLLAKKELEATYWKFEFLSVFLVPATKRVLSWFAGPHGGPITKEHYDGFWKTFITDRGQRETILSVLLFYGLLLQEDHRLRISDVGMQFLAFLGAKSSLAS
ncbi:MAG: hypothetical protein AB1700_05200 [Bacillota bacterium]